MDKKTPFTKEQLEAALFFARDVFERCACPYFARGATAWAIRHNEYLNGDKITLGVKEFDYRAAKSIFPEAIRLSDGKIIDIGEKKIYLEYKGVPVEIKIISKHYRFLDYLDSKMYAYDIFYLPNPFDAFWRADRWLH